MRLEEQNLIGHSTDEKNDHIFKCHKEIRDIKKAYNLVRNNVVDLTNYCVGSTSTKSSKNILWTAESIATYLNISKLKFFKLVKIGLPAVMIDKTWCAHIKNLERWFKQNTRIRTKERYNQWAKK